MSELKATIQAAGQLSGKVNAGRGGSGGIVDQTFDPSSANAQSGVAIAGELENYLIYSALEQIGVEHHLSYMVGMVVTIWLNINELISILENVAKITGKNAPSMLVKLLDRLKDGVEHRSDDEDGKH